MTSASLLRDRRGVAMIEFAYGLPVLLMVGLGGLECANLVLAHMQISRIASMTADNASRVRDSIDESDVTELMTGAQLTSGTLDVGASGRIILSQVQRNDAGTGQWIRWQRCYGRKAVNSSYGRQNAGKTDATLQGIGPVGRQVAASAGTSVMFVEVQYDYQPIVAGFFGAAPRTLRYNSAYNVRKRPNGDLTNAGSLAADKRNPC
jgi:hypothetical protein